MKNFLREEIMAIVYQLIAIFVAYDMWCESAIYARQYVYASDEFWGHDLEPVCGLHLVFSGKHADVCVYRADSSRRYSLYDSPLLNIRFGGDRYLTLYSYSPYIDIIMAMDAVVEPYKMFFELCDYGHCLALHAI